MKKQRIPDDFLRNSELGQVMVPILDRLKSLSELKSAFENCVVSSLDTGKPIVDPYQLVATLKRTRPTALATLPSAEALYDLLRQSALGECDKATALFDKKLRGFCEKHSFKIEGRFPTYLVDAFLPVKVKEFETEIGTRSIGSPLADSVAPILKEMITEERGRKFDRVQFLDRMYQAYERCLLLNKATLGDPIPVRKVYQELILFQQPDAFLKSAKKTHFREYTVEHFSRDLAKLLECSPCQTSGGKWLSDRPTSFPAEGVSILQRGQARIVGKIVFSGEPS